MDTNTDFNLPVSVQIKNSRGQDAPATDVIWASSDETVLRVVPTDPPDPTSRSMVVQTVAVGSARVTVTADADIGAGVATITGVSEVVNVADGPGSVASTIAFTFGTPVPK